MSQKKFDIYARFLNLARAVEQSEYADLDVDLKGLLEFIAIKSHKDNASYRITDLIMNKELGSPATIHARIKKMVDLGYFELALDTKDSRVKYVNLGAKADSYLAALNRSFSLATKA